MAVINFYLREKSSKEPTPITLFFSFEGRRVKCATGEKVLPSNWDEKRQRVKAQATGALEINRWLNKLADEALRIYREALLNGVQISEEFIRGEIRKLRPQSDECNVFERFTEFINLATDKSQTTRGVYKATLKHLHDFATKEHFSMTFENVATLQFYDDFSAFLRRTGDFTDNTVGKYLKTVKTFLNFGLRREWHKSANFQQWKIKHDSAFYPALTRDEFRALWFLDLSTEPHLQRVQDAFVFACLVGLRDSDMRQLQSHHIQNDTIQIVIRKTKGRQIFPLEEETRRILEKYNYDLPKLENQNSNRHLKEIGKRANFTRLCEVVRFKGGQPIPIVKPLWQWLSTHVARRTFSTLTQESKMPLGLVQLMTGHSDPRILQNSYFRSTDSALKESYGKFIESLDLKNPPLSENTR